MDDVGKSTVTGLAVPEVIGETTREIAEPLKELVNRRIKLLEKIHFFKNIKRKVNLHSFKFRGVKINKLRIRGIKIVKTACNLMFNKCNPRM